MDYRHYFPSKQFLFLLGSITLAGLIIYGASIVGKGATWREAVSLSPAKSAVNPNMADSDNDGLPDWEEAVRGTDPHKADSDSDGTSDGDEVKTGRNPMKAGPNDSLASAENEKFLAELAAAASSTNLTDTVSRSLFAEYVGARAGGTSGDVAAQQKIVDEVIAKANIGLKGRTYTQQDLIVASNDANSIRSFSNIFIRTGHRHPTATFQNAIGALTLSLDNGDPAAVNKLKLVGQEYRALARDLSEIPVPALFVSQYLKVINSIENAGAAFNDIAYVTEDPVRSVAGLKNYNAMTTVCTEAVLGLAKMVAQSGVKFSSTEPGLELYAFAGSLTLVDPR